MKSSMPKEIEKLYEPLRNELLLLYAKREIYRHLYESGGEVIGLLNFGGSNFFALLRQMLIDDILITIRRLIDREESYVKRGKRANLSLLYLKSQIKDPQLKKDLGELITQLVEITESAALICSRRIAHSDLRYKLDLEELPQLEMKSIEDALRSMQSVLNTTFAYWDGNPIVYDVAGLTLRGNAQDLVSRLRQADYYCQQLRQLEASL